MSSKKFVIIDGNAIIHRAYHALPPLTAKGTMVNAVYGFTSMLLKVINDLKPDYLAVSFDVAGGTFRDKISKDYKATRVKADQELYDQIPLCYDVARAFNIPIYTKQGFEADDVIGTVSEEIKKLRNKEIECVVVTGDMDTLQLVDNKTKVFALRKGITDTVLYDAEEVKKKYGFGPEYIVDYKALKGDASDNIPGVPGIGEKTATELIQKVGGVEKIYKEIKKTRNQEIKKSVIEKLLAGEESAKMSKELATIVRDIKGLDFKLENCEVKPFNTEKIGELFKKFEFWSLLKRMPGAKVNENPKKQDTNKSQITNSKLKIIEIDKNNLDDFAKEIEKAGEFACKEILSGANVLDSELLGLMFAFENKTYYLGKSGKSWKSVFSKWNTDNHDYQDKPGFLKIFFDESKTLVGHDLKRLVKSLFCHAELVSASLEKSTDGKTLKQVQGDNFAFPKLFDIMIASYVLNSSTRAHDLKSIVLRELGRDLSGGTEQNSLFGANPEAIAEELRLILEIKKKQQKQLEKMSDLGLFEKMEMPLIPVLAEMELNGVKIDIEKMKGLSRIVNRDIEKVTKKIWKQAGEEFNVASSVQLRDILFEKLKLPSAEIKKGKTGYSTAEPELEKLLNEHPIISLILEHRELAKLQSTYVDVLPNLINKKTGRLHTSFNQAVTTTGRLSSSDPNLQNIPARGELSKEIRNAFVAERGYNLISADYSQIELRIVASMAKDKKMMEIFEKSEDIHRATAAAINGLPLDKVTKEMRQAAKEINFGVLYGMGAYGLSWRAGIPKWQAKEFIEKYFSEFSGVKKYIDETLKFARKEGYVETLFGRRRYIPELKADNFQLRSAGERMAINMPIQGTAADLMKMAMISIHENMKNVIASVAKQSQGDRHAPPARHASQGEAGRSGLAMTDIKLILQVHDELVFEVKQGLEDEATKIIKNTMENVVKLNVPVEVHVSVGKRWGELK